MLNRRHVCACLLFASFALDAEHTSADPDAKPKLVGEMVNVPKGTFTMGDEDNPPRAPMYSSKPMHQVTLSAFSIDKTEVTVAAYAECVAAGKCKAADEAAVGGRCNGTGKDKDKLNHPVNCVSWTDATTYCAWVNKRLPTEAEWEYAARGSDGRVYPWGNEEPDETRVAFGNKATRASVPVGSFPKGASPFGVLDMAGNVSEMVADWDGPYKADAVTDPQGPKQGMGRMVRGSNFQFVDRSDARLFQAAARFQRVGPDTRSFQIGFRCARSD